MSNYMALLDQRKKLDAQIEAMRADEVAAVTRDIKEKMAMYSLTVADLGLGGLKRGPKPNRGSGPVAPKYRDPETGATWSGRGKPPRWIAGKDRTPFHI